jgi:sulfide:quinone oxidoreductase
MAHIVILGAGIGGLPAAYEIRHELGKEHRVTVINPHDHFQFVPSNPWVAVGWRRCEEICVPLRPNLKRKGIEFVKGMATRIDPEARRVETTEGPVDYDYLVIATGPRLAFDEVPGAGPGEGGNTLSVCTTEHAERAWTAYQRFVGDPGPVVVGAFQGASCFGPAYEFAMILDTDLRKRRIRDRVPMTFVTSEPYIGHMGLGGVGRLQGPAGVGDAPAPHQVDHQRPGDFEVEADKMFVEQVDDDRASPSASTSCRSGTA